MVSKHIEVLGECASDRAQEAQCPVPLLFLHWTFQVALEVNKSESRSTVSESLRPHGILQARMTGVGSLSLLQGIFPNPGIEPRSPALQADSLPTKLSAKP